MAPRTIDKSVSCIRLEDVLSFNQLTCSLASSPDLDAILRTIFEHMERLIKADLWMLLMLDEARHELYYALAAGGKEAALRDLRVKVGEGVAGWVAEHGEAFIIPEITDSGPIKKYDPLLAEVRTAHLRSMTADLKDSAPQVPIKLHSVIAMPLRGNKGTHGVIEILNPDVAHLDVYTIAFLHIMADHAAIAIENARNVVSIRQLTITDETTGLFNVRHLYQVLERELERTVKLGLPLSLAFLDLDSFKLVNDNYGHLVGSELLAMAGRRLKELSRKEDQCFRYGGDEFVIVMPETPAFTALNHIAELHHALLDSRFTLKNGLELGVSASIGLATAPADGTSVDAILAVADERMYEVKLSGRGQVSGAPASR
jgi:diguanylate cyclase (GGDEF)-like protein